ncbi:MAG: transporter, ATP-binding protein NosF [Chthonomonadaceae bacterium]|nr:transporter, ATP-binding protein NosF [Chthonomonadaceae bacterium]
MIVLERASRWYGQVLGLNDVSCVMPVGITALLGENGAGKSTLIKLITGQLKPTTGRTLVLGMPPFANPRVFRKLGYCPEIENNYDELTGREFVTLLAHMAGLPAATLKARVSESIETVGMTGAADRKIGGYSKGMRQRIKVAQGIVHDPDVLVLDEPLNGLDPLGRRDISTLLHELAGRGKCIVISSHILYEVEQLTRNMLLMHKGRLMAQGDIYQIRGLIDSHPHHITITTDQARPLAKHLLDLPYILSAKFDAQDPRLLEIETHAPDQFYAQFPDIVLEHGYTITNFESPDNNLEAVFKYLVNG